MVFVIPFLIGLGVTILLYLILTIWASSLGFFAVFLILSPIGTLLVPLIIGTLVGLIRLFTTNYQNKIKKISISIFGILVVVLSVLIIKGSFNYSDRMFMDSRDIDRKSDILDLKRTLSLYYQKNRHLPSQITTEQKNISKSGSDLCQILVPDYVMELPKDILQDPGVDISDCNSDYNTGYSIFRNEAGDQFTITAPKAEGEKISITSDQLK